ncbi:MAG: T9SS type A sorting domain-containing protein [Rhodothermales bacterium]|nr:T9SS type A sorting domain-containing protein [Rhodothermales bacterium]
MDHSQSKVFNQKVRRSVSVVALVLLVSIVPGAATAQFVVDEGSLDNSDFDLEDGVCSTCTLTDDDGNCITVRGCTLVAAIENANRFNDFTEIGFSVSQILNPTNSLPEIIFPTKIAGNLASGIIEIVGPGPTDNSPGLVVSGQGAAGSIIEDVIISGYPNGIEIVNASDVSVLGSVILNSQIGGNGILVSGTSERTIIGGETQFIGDYPGNIIGGNGTGIRLVGGGDNIVQGNRIGFDGSGNSSGNNTGILVGTGAGEGTLIGGDSPNLRNIISNNNFDGIAVSGTGFGVTEPVRDIRIFGNYIGTYEDGTGRQGNLRGITLTRTEGIQIGGDQEGEGNLISGNGDGIWLNNNANNTRVVNNILGLDITNDTLSNGNGIVIRALARLNTIEDNLIAGNSLNGIQIISVNELKPSANTIEKNGIGVLGLAGNSGSGISVTDADSTTIRLNDIKENGEHGILIQGDSRESFIQSNTISGSVLDGVRISDLDDKDPSMTTVELNTIGVDTDAMSSTSGNGGSGVTIQEADSTTIGLNTITANSDYGIQVSGFDAIDTFIFENSIGVGKDITKELGNEKSGVLLSAVNGVHVEGNVIGYNRGDGLELLSADSTTVIENNVGNAPAPILFARFPNGEAGVRLRSESDDNIIGSTDSTKGNVFAYNKKGVVVEDGQRNSILGNQIYFNHLGSIDLNDDGFTTNDNLDEDIGPNGLQNSPVFTGSSQVGMITTHEGVIMSKPSAVYRIEFFSTYPEYFPEADMFLGAANVTTDASGMGAFSFQYTGLDPAVSATATDSLGNTSELNLVTDVEEWFLRKYEIMNEDTDDIEVDLHNTNIGSLLISGPKLKIITSANVTLASLYNVDTDQDIACTGGPDYECSLDDVQSVSTSKLRATFVLSAAGAYEIRAIAEGMAGTETIQTNEVVIEGEGTVGIDELTEPERFAITAIYPNPFQVEATIRISNLQSGEVDVSIYDILGRRVWATKHENVNGSTEITWDGRSSTGTQTSAGVYFVVMHLNGSDILTTRKIVRIP